MTGPPDAPDPAGDIASGARISDQLGGPDQEAENTRAAAAVKQPYYVAAHGDSVFGMIEADMFGGFRASCWRGPIGTFPTSLEAERALLAEPRAPKKPRRPTKPMPPLLTLAGAGGPVFHDKKQIGGWIRTAAGYAAWWRGGKVGVHETPGLAGNAVLDAYLEAKAKAQASRRNGKDAMSAGPVLGVDIGVSGALALIDPDGALIAVHDMPCLCDGLAGRRSINAALLAEIIAKSHATTAFVEYVGPRPHEGAVGAFAFGRARGVVEGVMAALGLPIAFITPPAWKRIVGIAPGKAGAKDAARSEAVRRWPEKASLFARARDDGRAESALIAVAGVMREARR